MASAATSPLAAANKKMTNFRWTICALLFLATTVNYMDRQVLSLTWKEFISPEFHWTDANYGLITAVFSIVYAVANLLAGRFIDWMGTKKGYLWAIGVWSAGACLHAVCGVATEATLGIHDAAGLVKATGDVAMTIATVSVYFFLAARTILALGEAGNFPAAIKVTAEYFPKRDRAYATSIFNAGSAVGALIAPFTIGPLAKFFQSIGWGNGWEMAFIIIGALGFVWMGFWVVLYKKPAENPHVNAAELAYIEQDNETADESAKQKAEVEDSETATIPFWKCFKYPQTWAVFVGKFMTDGVWWFFLFWTPAYITDVFKLSTSSGEGMVMIFVLYLITMLSIYGGKLPTIFIDRAARRGVNIDPYAARMRAMLIFAVFPLLALLAQPLSSASPWLPIIIIGIAGAAHQSWSANIYSVVGDMFPKSTIATIIGIGGMAGGLGSFLINYGSGILFDYAAQTNMSFMSYEGKPAGYFIVFCICGVAYLVGWAIMKLLVPRYKKIEV
ncbi:MULTISPECIES: MFS transporter [Duncaniella]|jgi:ACS family hexuronate transporter-like MFS transporter|uniref:MFS transporter n=1 Tax=Duncaniella TaxID=2518495 RepID=UPI000AE73A5D|nr:MULTISPECIES: MFS transporter [Duncaniella]MCX4284750.1 MFS transporter [Duncaniella dubosii]ROS88639.1 MFS transporter [Muribaculaceae bacterium Isolate-080 (Janvier)]